MLAWLDKFGIDQMYLAQLWKEWDQEENSSDQAIHCLGSNEKRGMRLKDEVGWCVGHMFDVLRAACVKDGLYCPASGPWTEMACEFAYLIR